MAQCAIDFDDRIDRNLGGSLRKMRQNPRISLADLLASSLEVEILLRLRSESLARGLSIVAFHGLSNLYRHRSFLRIACSGRPER